MVIVQDVRALVFDSIDVARVPLAVLLTTMSRTGSSLSFSTYTLICISLRILFIIVYASSLPECLILLKALSVYLIQILGCILSNEMFSRIRTTASPINLNVTDPMAFLFSVHNFHLQIRSMHINISPSVHKLLAFLVGCRSGDFGEVLPGIPSPFRSRLEQTVLGHKRRAWP